MNDTLVDKNDPLKQNWERGELVFIGGDVVAEYIDMVVEVDQSIEADLDAKISDQAQVATLGGSSAKFEYNRSSKGKYHFKVSAPVIIAYMPRKQAGAGTLSVVDDNPMTLEEIGKFLESRTLEYNQPLQKN